MTTILRLEGTASFPLAAGTIDFSDAEVDDVELVPFRNQVLSYSQEDDLTIYNNGPEHWEITVTFVVDTFETLERLSLVRDHQAPLTLWPSMRSDPNRRFEVLWTNPNDLIERLRRGYMKLGYAFQAKFREPLGEVCRPPLVTS